VTDDEKNVRFVGLNATKGALATIKVRDALKAGQIDEAQAQQFVMEIEADPMMMQPANVVAELDVDIEVDESADAPTLQIEQFDQLTKIAPMAPPQFIPTLFEMLIEASNLRNKDKLREVLQQAKQPDPMQEMAGAAAQAELAKTESETARNMAQAEATMAKAQADALSAGIQAGIAV
jgi:hypothetical protein